MNVDEYVIIIKNILKIVGLYPINFFRYFVCLFSMFLIVLPQFFQLYFQRNDFSVILETSSVLSTILLAILKSFVWFSNPKTQKLVEFMFNDYWRLGETFDKTNLMHRYANLGKNITRAYLALILNALLIFYSIQPLKIVFAKFHENSETNRAKNFPFIAAYPKFCHESPFFEITYGSQMLATTICGIVILGTDCLIATALFHTSGHFQILQENLCNLNNYFILIRRTEKQQRYKLRNEMLIDLQKRLARLINYHQIVIRFSDDAERVFNPIMLLQVTASSLIICLVGIQVDLMLSNSEKLVEYFSYLAMALFQVFLFCWPGDELIFQSSMVGDAAFSMKWYNAPSYIKNQVLLIILRSQKPSCLTAGKFYMMCMENFATILSTSLSYFTLLRSVNSTD